MTLNPAQQAAVESTAALKVVIAGPGSGKTRTMVEAMAKAKGRVAVMTFMNVGANELRTRWLPYETNDMKLAHCGTLHSYCFKLIQRFGGFMGYIPGKVGILPEAERIPRLLQCRDKLGVKISQKVLLDLSRKDCSSEETLIWLEYEFLLKRNNLVDYNGILSEALELLGLTEVHCQIKLDYLFVDEFQDSAQIDQLIYEAIPAVNKMYVGDGDQSIFGFRGANPMGFVHLASAVFDNSITDAEGFKLELNYRSDQRIAEVANALIRHNKERVEKEIVPVSVEDGVVQVDAYEDVSQELAALAATIFKIGTSCAVLYRMNHDAKVCRDYLQAMGLPVQVPKFEQRPADWERAKLLLGLAIAPTEILVERYLKMKYDPRAVERWRLESIATGCELIALARLVHLPEGSSEHEIQLYLAANGIGESTRYIIQARTELLSPDADLSDLLHDLHSNEKTKASNEAEGVYVGTGHSAKGLEFDVVFAPACEDECYPGRDDIEEARRLLFVICTRARHELYLSWCSRRQAKWGAVQERHPSRFLVEMGL